MKKTTKRRWGLALIAAGTIAILSSCSSNESSDPGGTVITIKQPITAQQVAAKIGCGSFKQLGPAQMYVIDSGTCVIDGVKYGIDTFASTAVRDSWLKIAQNYGVVPKWETATAIIYKATKQ